MSNFTVRFTDSDDALVEQLQERLGSRPRSDVIRAALFTLDAALAEQTRRIELLQHRLEMWLKPFDRSLVTDVGFDVTRNEAWVRVDGQRYHDTSAFLVWVERRLENGAIERTRIEQDGEVPEKTLISGRAAWVGQPSTG